MNKLRKGYDAHYRHIPPPKSGMLNQGSQLTPIAKIKSKLPFNCDHCGLLFEKYACWAKRTAHHYCSRACCWAAKVIRIPKSCAVCNTEMFLTPTYYKRTSTCSRLCLRKNRVTNNSNLRSSPDYIGIVNRLRKNTSCNTCNTTSGPWVVANIKTWVENGLSCADGEGAYLLCKQCHLKTASNEALNSLYIVNRNEYKERNLKEKKNVTERSDT